MERKTLTEKSYFINKKPFGNGLKTVAPAHICVQEHFLGKAILKKYSLFLLPGHLFNPLSEESLSVQRAQAVHASLYTAVVWMMQLNWDCNASACVASFNFTCKPCCLTPYRKPAPSGLCVNLFPPETPPGAREGLIPRSWGYPWLPGSYRASPCSAPSLHVPFWGHCGFLFHWKSLWGSGSW